MSCGCKSKEPRKTDKELLAYADALERRWTATNDAIRNGEDGGEGFIRLRELADAMAATRADMVRRLRSRKITMSGFKDYAVLQAAFRALVFDGPTAARNVIQYT